MRNGTLAIAVVLAAMPPSAGRVFSDETGLVQLAGTPEQIGTLWGQINKETIVRDIETSYVKKAAAAGISQEMLLQRAAVTVRIIEQLAPHWLEETRAVARAAGVPEDLYVAYLDGVTRDRFLRDDPEECTSYAVYRDHARDGAILFHKTRDNREVAQAAYLVESSLEGINKHIAVSNATGMLGYSMMVNDKGLAGACDYPANLKKDSSTLTLEPAPNKFRGLMSGTILRHIAERASNCAEALAIIEDCVARGWYAGGTVGGNHWLFVDREGTILEVCNNPGHVASMIHTQKAYFSRLNNSPAALRLRESAEPIDFGLFRAVSRDPSICFGSSISGMTVEIDPDDPARFTCAWVALPVRAVAIPVLMGQSQIPRCLVDGAAYGQGKRSTPPSSRWEAEEKTMHAEKEQLKRELQASIDAGNPERAHTELMEQWSARQAKKLMAALAE